MAPPKPTQPKTLLTSAKDITKETGAINWIKTLATYKEPDLKRSLFELVITFVPFIALWSAAVWAWSISFWLVLPFCILASGFLVRLFLIQHDCSHGAFFKSKAINDWTGRAIGILTVTPYDLWQRSHLIHHSSHGNLDKRGIGDVLTLTVEEYNARSFWGRLSYRLYRNPIVLFCIGPIFIFLLHHRLPVGFMRAGAKYWISTMGTNVAIAFIMVAGIYFLGWLPFLITYLLTTCFAAAVGVWLFYVQHQFEDTVWEKNDNWQLHDAALYGSTHYDLPLVLRWMTANIGIHHIHHLYSRIPYYRLSKVLRDHPKLAQIRRLTIWDSLKTIRLKLWDEQERRLVTWKEARQKRKAATV
ncbi:MAG: fatty acid desaturase [bacterium]